MVQIAPGTRSPSRMEPGEKPESASGIGGSTQPIGVVYVPVGLAGCNGVIRFTVVEQDVSPPLPVEIMRTLQPSLDTDDNGDKVIFRQSGGESSLRTSKSGHTATRADQFDPTGWQFPEIADSSQNEDQGVLTNYMSDIDHLHLRPRRMNDNTPTGDHDATSTRSSRPLQKTSSHGNGIAKSHLTNIYTSSSRFRSGKQMNSASGMFGRAMEAASLGEITRHGTLWTTKQWKRLAHCLLYVPCAACFDTLAWEFLMLIPMGRAEDIQLALRRREQREAKNKKSNVANLTEVQ